MQGLFVFLKIIVDIIFTDDYNIVVDERRTTTMKCYITDAMNPKGYTYIGNGRKLDDTFNIVKYEKTGNWFIVDNYGMLVTIAKTEKEAIDNLHSVSESMYHYYVSNFSDVCQEDREAYKKFIESNAM